MKTVEESSADSSSGFGVTLLGTLFTLGAAKSQNSSGSSVGLPLYKNMKPLYVSRPQSFALSQVTKRLLPDSPRTDPRTLPGCGLGVIISLSAVILPLVFIGGRSLLTLQLVYITTLLPKQ